MHAFPRFVRPQNYDISFCDCSCFTIVCHCIVWFDWSPSSKWLNAFMESNISSPNNQIAQSCIAKVDVLQLRHNMNLDMNILIWISGVSIIFSPNVPIYYYHIKCIMHIKCLLSSNIFSFIAWIIKKYVYAFSFLLLFFDVYTEYSHFEKKKMNAIFWRVSKMNFCFVRFKGSALNLIWKKLSGSFRF